MGWVHEYIKAMTQKEEIMIQLLQEKNFNNSFPFHHFFLIIIARLGALQNLGPLI